MTLELTVVDSFTDRPFTGNPAAVAVVDGFPADADMQAVAAEMNLAETAFVARRGDGDHDLRWFTPSVEIDLCGHATLAAAHVLGGSGRFHTRSGVLACTPGPAGLIEMDFPATPSTAADLPPDLSIERSHLVRAWPFRRPDRAVRRRRGSAASSPTWPSWPPSVAGPS